MIPPTPPLMDFLERLHQKMPRERLHLCGLLILACEEGRRELRKGTENAKTLSSTL
jgi:hypothetical protein